MGFFDEDTPKLRYSQLAPVGTPDLVDVFMPESACILWLRLEFAEWDLRPKRYEGASVGDVPDWLEYEIDGNGLESIWSDPSRVCVENNSDHPFNIAWINWALENGIAPGQPFSIVVPPPVYSTSYEGETDVDWDSYLGRVVPWSEDRVLRAWTKVLFRLERLFKAQVMHIARSRNKARLDTSAMYLVKARYTVGSSDWGFGYDQGIRFALHTNHHTGRMWTSLADGQNRDGNADKAMEVLLADAAAKLPHIPAEVIRGLPVKNA